MKDPHTELAQKLYFSKEAADYLGISVQRLAKLTQEGKVRPLKKNTSGTVYHADELERRKKELSIFSSEYDEVQRKKGMFSIDTPTRNEAINLAVIMNILRISEKKAVLLLDSVDTGYACDPMLENLSVWSEKTGRSHAEIETEYKKTAYAFSSLNQNDAIIRLGDPDYPRLLAQTDEAPRFLYLRGRANLLKDIRTVALVGSRNAGDEGKHNTARVTRILGKNGIIIVSGLAKGIDVTAHRTALENGIPTIAVIGTNLNQCYPSENAEVQKQIEKDGLVVSQFSPATKTERWFFPLRDGVMSGLSQATVIMEAGETSGALQQARYALKQGRLVLIPQNAFNIPSISWPQKFEKKGAIRVKNPGEIIEILSERKVYNRKEDMYQDDLFSRYGNGMIVAEAEDDYKHDRDPD